ncbi:MAG TPA: DUF4149 domain-containing protein, partial [Nitrospiraceae bacterium]|nr:DUF4149 domain-containing protein [Nitrospiraceae bacterium]
IVGSVIPAVFNSFGMEAGGRFLTRVFDGYNRFVLAAIALLIAAGAGRVWIAARYRFSSHPSIHVEFVLLGLMIAVALTITLWLEPRSVGMQEAAFAVKDGAAKKTAYGAFFQAHSIVRGLYVTNLALGIVLIAVKLKSYINSGGS